MAVDLSVPLFGHDAAVAVHDDDDGGMAEYLLVPATRYLIPLGNLDPREVAPLTDAGLPWLAAQDGVARTRLFCRVDLGPAWAAKSPMTMFGLAGVRAIARSSTARRRDPTRRNRPAAPGLSAAGIVDGAHRGVGEFGDHVVRTGQQWSMSLANFLFWGCGTLPSFASLASTSDRP